MIIIDHFESTFAVCEQTDGQDTSSLSLPRALLPADAREGDVLFQLPDGSWKADPILTHRRRTENITLLHHLQRKT